MGAKQKSYSGKTAELIDQEVRRIIDESYQLSTKLLKENVDILHAMGEALMKYETLDAAQVQECMDRKTISEPEGWSKDSSTEVPSKEEKPKKSVRKPKEK
jgi:cell division protease FtsH